MIARFARCSSGAAAVEAALVMPILILLGLCSADAGAMMLDAHKMKSGVATSARMLARARTPATVETEARNLAVTGQRTGGTARVRGWTTGGVTVSYRNEANGGLYNGSGPVRIVRVEGILNYTGFSLLRMAGVTSPVVRVAQEERWIG
jgi:Flp pilus assembly protein TadG